MNKFLYANTIRDPQSKSVDKSHQYLVCKKINNQWHIIESHGSADSAARAMNILAEHDLIHGHITDIRNYQVFIKDLFEIKYSL